MRRLVSVANEVDQHTHVERVSESVLDAQASVPAICILESFDGIVQTKVDVETLCVWHGAVEVVGNDGGVDVVQGSLAAPALSLGIVSEG